jgi:hypothetical protein
MRDDAHVVERVTLRSSTGLSSQTTTAESVIPQIAPWRPHAAALPTTRGSVMMPLAKFTRAHERKASKPASAPVWAPLIELKKRQTALTRNSAVNSGAFKM